MTTDQLDMIALFIGAGLTTFLVLLCLLSIRFLIKHGDPECIIPVPFILGLVFSGLTLLLSYQGATFLIPPPPLTHQELVTQEQEILQAAMIAAVCPECGKLRD